MQTSLQAESTANPLFGHHVHSKSTKRLENSMLVNVIFNLVHEEINTMAGLLVRRWPFKPLHERVFVSGGLLH